MTSPPPFKRSVKAVWDLSSWLAATLIVVGSRYAFDLNGIQWTWIAGYAVGVLVLQMIVGMCLKLYRGRYRTASFEEGVGLALAAAIVGSITAIAWLASFQGPQFPRALVVLTPPVALLLMGAGRCLYRATTGGRGPHVDADKIIIYGAGNAGYQLLRLLASHHAAPYHAVGLIDDAKEKQNLRLLGVPVLGGRDNLLSAAQHKEAKTVVLAVTDASAELVRELAGIVEGAGLRFMVLPPVSEMVGGRVSLSDIREVDVEDVLGRHQVQTNVREIAGFLSGKCVLVTGAGGSIGSELARQIHKYGPSELVLLDRDESALHSVQLSIYGQGLLDTPDIVLCDIRDSEALNSVFQRHQPDIVFHAAALKHLPMLEQYPDEGWKTNVLGTVNVLAAAQMSGCAQFINISTDKAANPISVLGRSKRLAEQLTSWFAATYGVPYLSVRFGNVLGSRGSMLHTFTTQIASGGPVTVTHPDVTRYFMTIPEACELTVQAAAIGEPGEVLVLDMGEPIRILDVATRLVEKSVNKIDIVFTGLRHGEKMHEALFGDGESGTYKQHPLIAHVSVPPMDPDQLWRVSINSAEGTAPRTVARESHV